MKQLKNRLRQWPWLVRLWWLLCSSKAKLFKPRPKRLYDLVLQQDDAKSLTKRALVAYIVEPFSIAKDDPHFLSHINMWCAQEMVRVLNQLGYTVDVVDYRDASFIPRKKYDLFIGHGGINFEKIAQRICDSTTKIYFSTGCYWKFHNEQELARFAALSERRGVNLPGDRFIKNSEEGALLIADGIIGIGNDFTRKTYAGFSPVIMLNGTSLFDDHYERHYKDFEAGRAHFLYFAGSGPVHKGLDLLLEGFVGLEQHLWICSKIGQQFEKVYSDELHNLRNIHLVGWVQPRSPKFYELMSTCNYVIFPSCSEGQAQSIVECMNQGLIPVVTQACGLDVEGCGVILDPCTIEEITRVVLRLASLSGDQCKMMSVKARRAATSNFSEYAFANNMKNALQRVIGHRRPKDVSLVRTEMIRRHRVNSHGTIMAPFFVDENRNIAVDQEATQHLQSKNDRRYFQDGRGIVEVDIARWEEAQRYEWRSWMEGSGLEARSDRNIEHKRHFENYGAIQGRTFDNAIEIGCGPFTNMVRIQKYVRCGSITLLDPLIADYLTHPHCTYKDKRLGGWFGKKVRTVAIPFENFNSDEVYDLVVVINVLEHCFSMTKLFERIISLTSPNGIIVFHDKLIAASAVQAFVENVYDAGHPLRVVENLVLEFLSENYVQLYRKDVTIPSPIGGFDSIYFIGQKRGRG